MTNKQLFTLIVALAVIVVVAVGAVSLFPGRTGSGSGDFIAGSAGNLLAENYDPYLKQNGGFNTNLDIKTGAALQTTGTLNVGSGTDINSIRTGTCVLRADTSIAATSTGTGTCSITGVAAGDRVFVSIATTSTAVSSQIFPIAALASTNTVTVVLFNLTGGAIVPGSVSGFASSTQYWIVN